MRKTTILILALLINSAFLLGQAQNKKVPLKKEIHYGVLDNGLTYYILPNKYPKNRASFYIVHNVGAILEEDNQNGLAHFLEHMAFNGTKHFPDKGIINYLEKNGVKFGRNINAYTSIDETAYNISNVPTQNIGLVDSCLLILSDWSQNLLLTEEEIDAERGVITEEWRTRRTSKYRIIQKKKELFYDSKYSQRDVIGDLDVINNHKYKTLRKFYKDWYRPDLQAIIVIGDIDANETEKKVKDMFSELETVKRPKERKYYEVPDNIEPRYVLATDKEATTKTIDIRFKYDVVKREDKNLEYIRDSYSKAIFSSMIKNRISEKMKEENSSIINARAGMMFLYRTKNIASLIVSYKNDSWEDALTDVCSVVENVKEYGFTETEFARAKKNFFRKYENSYKLRAKAKNESFIMGIKSHFLKGEPYPGIEFKYNYLKEILPELKIEEINKWSQVYLTDKNMLIAVTGPSADSASYPGKDEIVAVVNKVKNAKLEPYVDTYKEKELMPVKPAAGTIISEKHNPEIDAVEYVLSNGIKVYAKKTDVEKEKIQCTAYSAGGASKLDDRLIPNYMLLKGFTKEYGVGDFTSSELKMALSGKIVGVNAAVSRYYEAVDGSSSPQDLETMFQLFNLHFTNPRFDKKAFKTVKSRYMSFVKNISKDVNRAFKDSINRAIYNNHPRVKLFSEDILNQIIFEGIKEVYEDRFANPGDFTFMLVGDFEHDKLKVLLEKYVASLPTTNNKETYTDHGIRLPQEDIINHFKKEMTTSKASVYVNFHKKAEFTEENKICLYMISQLLGKRYMDEIREKEGGTYGVSVKYKIKRIPSVESELFLQFDCDHNKADRLTSIALKEIEELINGKVLEHDLDEVKKNMAKERTEYAYKLKYWYEKLYNYVVYNDSSMDKDAFIKYVNSVSSEDIIKKANEFLYGAKKIEIIMSPTE